MSIEGREQGIGANEEVIRARPCVFEHEQTAALAAAIALRYLRILEGAEVRSPINLCVTEDAILDESLEKRREKHREELKTMVDNSGDFAGLRMAISEQIHNRLGAELRTVLSDEVTEAIFQAKAGKITKQVFGKEYKNPLDVHEIILSTIKSNDYSSIDASTDPELYKFTVSCALVTDKARNISMRRALESMDSSAAERYGMSIGQRDVVLRIIGVLSKLNTEYLRHKSRVLAAKPYAGDEVDSVRERLSFVRLLEPVVLYFQEQSRKAPVFGGAGEDKNFTQYLESIMAAYNPVTAQGNPVGSREHQERLEQMQHKFYELYATYPSFPLILTPPLVHYDADEVLEDSGDDGGDAWRSYGYDPEIRAYWMNKEQRARQEQYSVVRDRFADCMQEQGVPVDSLRRKFTLIGHLIGSGGISVVEDPLGQEDTERPRSGEDLRAYEKTARGMVLVIERPQKLVREEFYDAMKRFGIPKKEFKSIVDNEYYVKMYELMTSLHEFGHSIYGDKTEAANRLGRLDESLSEGKSDLLMATTYERVLEPFAQQWYGDEHATALKVMYVLDLLRSRNLYAGPDTPHSDPYALSAALQCQALLKAGVLRKSKAGYSIDMRVLKSSSIRDMLGVTSDAILNVYRAAGGRSVDTTKLRKTARTVKKLGIDADKKLVEYEHKFS